MAFCFRYEVDRRRARSKVTAQRHKLKYKVKREMKVRSYSWNASQLVSNCMKSLEVMSVIPGTSEVRTTESNIRVNVLDNFKTILASCCKYVYLMHML